MAFCARCGTELPVGATYCPSCGAPVQPGPSAAAPSAPVSGFDTLTKDQKAQEYWIQRLFAFVIDAIIVYAVLVILTVLIALPALFTGGLGIFTAFFSGISIVWGIVFVLYFAFMESTYGSSIGKRIFSLKVVSKTNARPNFAEAFIRNLSKIYWILLLLDVIIGLAISRGYQQKYSDHFMGTTVVHA
jgi:uncharacterized RDD family membrane protein YckC